ncbi:hypothetical protein [Sedimentitalea nanhaiensis]|uniref:Uncharacterized protein n=1 Tax=Sedimentitalea nanhaiensis TaxID=999627 RepID=A0A1I7BI51_9RHOB|nr:hypothetical protein [Sedimentitalea nanhaiensis]SFT86801.1 hypothetical protein SAMN05216236_11073 [Sedimentitalea nanhaiensis]
MAARASQTLAVAFPSHEPYPLTGMLELAVAETLGPGATRPERVTRVLSTVFKRISGQSANLSRVRCLTSSAREWLLQRAAGLFWSDTGWFQAKCMQCDTDFDIPTELANAPRKPAGQDFPVVTVRTSLGQRRFEVPNGVHEEHLARAPGSEPTRTLLAQCGLSPQAVRDARDFSRDDISRIEAALEAASPEVADEVVTTCPTCQAQTMARIDPLDFAFPGVGTLLAEVHAIAATYHWTEDAILALPSQRRHSYARLVQAGPTIGGRRR